MPPERMDGPPPITDLKIFVPARDFPISKAFYTALGGRMNWEHEGGMAEFQFGTARILLQDFYAKDWAENFVIQMLVSETDPWTERIVALEKEGRFPGLRHRGPDDEPWGQRILYVWDPSGILLHIVQEKSAD